MKTLKFDTKEAWFKARQGKVTGSRLKDIVVKRGAGEKSGFYAIIAERLLKPDAPDEEDDIFDHPAEERPTERGNRLEKVAIAEFTKKTKMVVDDSLLMWVRDDDESIAISPDGVISETEAVEVKCLASGKHVEALITQEIPSEYEYQVLQYFIVNDKLQTLYFCFYDPRLRVHEFFWIEVKRTDMLAQIEEYFIYQKVKLSMIDEAVKKLLA